jgi:hypothetical protein
MNLSTEGECLSDDEIRGAYARSFDALDRYELDARNSEV